MPTSGFCLLLWLLVTIPFFSLLPPYTPHLLLSWLTGLHRCFIMWNAFSLRSNVLSSLSVWKVQMQFLAWPPTGDPIGLSVFYYDACGKKMNFSSTLKYRESVSGFSWILAQITWNTRIIIFFPKIMRQQFLCCFTT